MLEFTENELKEYIKSVSKVFDVVRTVEPDICICSGSQYECYKVWGKNERCENCVSVHAIVNDKRTTKFEFMPDKTIYYVVAVPVRVDKKEVIALETVAKINDDTLVGAYGYNDFADKIVRYNDMLMKDETTGLYNRRYFNEHTEEMKKLNPNINTAVMMSDVDLFKYINDKFGHLTGDMVLCDIADIFKKHTDDNPRIFTSRFGGDEFITVFYGLEKEKIEKIKENINKDILNLSQKYNYVVSVSMGTAYADDNKDIKKLIDEADKNMYEEKNIRHGR